MKVNPDRARRYVLRTLTRPEASYVITPKEKEELAAWDEAWRRNMEDPSQRPPLWDWQNRVERYAKAKGSRTVTTVEERPSDGSAIIRWRLEGER